MPIRSGRSGAGTGSSLSAKWHRATTYLIQPCRILHLLVEDLCRAPCASSNRRSERGAFIAPVLPILGPLVGLQAEKDTDHHNDQLTNKP